MSKIIAAGLTPAWQQIIQLKQLRIGEVNRATEAHWCASGKVLNVAIALHHLGADVLALALIGGRNGHRIREEFGAANIPARWVETDSPTRVCTTLLDQSRQSTTELVENSRPVPPSDLDRFLVELGAVRDTAHILVLSGSLPEGAPMDLYQRALERFAGKALLDARGEELLRALPCRPFLVKPNREELAHTVGRDLTDERALMTAMRTLNERGAQWVVVTQGPDELLATSSTEFIRLTPPRVKTVINPIGCGDCLTAGIAWGLSQNKPMRESLKLGMAAAAQNLTQLLPARLDPSQTLQLASGVV